MAKMAGSAELADGGAGRYCRMCGYDLRASEARCPECGRPFDPANPHTYARRPPAGPVRRWARRLAVLVALVVLSYGGLLLWLWWGWRAEQTHIDAIPPYVKVTRAYPRLERLLHRRMVFLTDRVTGVSFSFGAVSESDMAHVGQLRHVRSVRLTGGPITDIGMKHLASLADLDELALVGTSIGDEGLSHLANLTKIERLYLGKTKVTDAGMAHLRRMTRLKALDLSDTAVTDAGLSHLSGMTRMEVLSLLRLNITDAGIDHLESMSNLRTLMLTGTRITDAGLDRLGNLPSLRYLDYRNAAVTSEASDCYKTSHPTVTTWGP